MSQGSFFALKIGSQWVLNHIIDAEGVRKPPDRHLGCYHSALGTILATLGRVLIAIRSPKGGGREIEPPTALRDQATERGGGEDKPLPGTGIGGFRFEEDCSKPLHALRPEASADDGKRA